MKTCVCKIDVSKARLFNFTDLYETLTWIAASTSQTNQIIQFSERCSKFQKTSALNRTYLRGYLAKGTLSLSHLEVTTLHPLISKNLSYHLSLCLRYYDMKNIVYTMLAKTNLHSKYLKKI